MVMNLALPSFSSPLRKGAREKGQQNAQHDDGNDNDNNNKNSDNGDKSNSDGKRPNNALNTYINNKKTPASASATLSEALRNNPFGNTSRSRALASEVHDSNRQIEDYRHRQQSENRVSLRADNNDDTCTSRPLLEAQVQVQDLNKSLCILAHLFPDVRAEVFRELLMRFDGNSRLHLCVEQLLRHKEQWVQGRWKLQPADGEESSRRDGRHDDDDNNNNNKDYNDDDRVSPDELFRSSEYKDTVKVVLCKEFGALSRSTIEAVLAESNFSYSRARPILKELSRKGWRATLSNLNPFKRKKDRDENPLVAWDRSAEGELHPRLKKTGSRELDLELHEALILPFLRDQKETQEIQDFLFSLQLSEQEAKAENALYECQCCLDDVTFEQISTCSSDGHAICFSCIRRTMHEALFGQGWDNSVLSARSTLKCIAPVSHGVCDGHLSPTLIKQAILLEKAGTETYRKFEERVASEALLKSRLKLVRCPFCSYAEVDPVFHPAAGQGLEWHYRGGNIFTTILTTIFLLDLIPLLSIPLLIPLLFYPHTLAAIFRTSLQNMGLRSRNKRFLCKNPSCQRASCLTCRKSWRDPHSCEEPLQQSLRTTVEAARTAAIKRTCPRCNLSFVKSSGCNKLTCVCGYSMCYLCRKALNPADANSNNNDDEDADVGYKHFCEHFRVNPGSRCSECNKCELYKAEDDEEIARKAGERAEREWRMRQSLAKTNNTNTTNNNKETAAAALLIDTTSSSSLWDPDSAQPQQHLLLNSVLHHANNTDNNKNAAWRAYSWRYWCCEVWRDGRWRWEVQAAADMILEKVIVVDV
ncbi:hypothetical protein PISL3812_08524 [Talaromyces islandicus]|uniref:RING-type domain-containing protein n=1 Tax=Talaromyces islandicus TaxID=28573 RepID=A0A0U1M7C1_TALIS|nr:hypothetical protein PISL3812_08524 [Talaromyces islandicus]